MNPDCFNYNFKRTFNAVSAIINAIFVCDVTTRGPKSSTVKYLCIYELIAQNTVVQNQKDGINCKI